MDEGIERVVNNLLPDKILEEVEEKNLNKDLVLHLWHELNRDDKRLHKALEKYLEKEKPIEEYIKLTEEQLEKMKKIKRGILQNWANTYKEKFEED